MTRPTWWRRGADRGVLPGRDHRRGDAGGLAAIDAGRGDAAAMLVADGNGAAFREQRDIIDGYYAQMLADR